MLREGSEGGMYAVHRCLDQPREPALNSLLQELRQGGAHKCTYMHRKLKFYSYKIAIFFPAPEQVFESSASASCR